jgi:cyclopropane fatty-acyl-phospholipid synthase-like methyltransferase
MMLRIVTAAAACLTSCKHADHVHHSFEDAEAWAARFEDPSRDAWQKPDDVLAELALPPNATVADIGSATGYFSVRLAKVLPQGHVFGVDVENAMVTYLNHRAEKEGLTNLTSLLGQFDDAKLPQPVDLIIIVNTYHHIEARPAYFKKLLGSLKAGGRLVIIDFTPESSMGPPVEAKLAPHVVQAELETAGFRPVAVSHTLPEQYFLVFTHP